MNNLFQRITTFLVVLALPALVIFATVHFGNKRGVPQEFEYQNRADIEKKVDHSEFEILQQEFKRPQDLTAACLSCHNKRDDELMASAHWKWERETTLPNGRGKVSIGKKNLINNYCASAESNNGSCMRCHIGYGWEDKSFDFGDPTNIDCVVCHDNTNTYKKRKGGAGMPSTAENASAEFPVPDYNYVAQNVGKPLKENCGFCHFNGGGGNNVKHGDLEEAMLDCSREIDVHMAKNGQDMSCNDCHLTERHNITGRAYSVSSENNNRATCEHCHTAAPHNDKVIDLHNHKVACQTCHIPIYAKANPTVMYWDWSVAGRRDENGDPITEYDVNHKYSYLSIKGHFVWDDHVKPEYFWFNGTADHYLYGDTITTIPVQINTLMGEYADADAKIWPVKVHRGKQAYDSVYKEIVNVKVFAENKGEGAFWEDLRWDTAIELGMKYADRRYSGKYDFVSTEMYWPLNHQVSPKEQTLQCSDCHTRSEEGRLANLAGFYLPGRDYARGVDYTGLAIIIISLLGVIIHSVMRVVARKH
ncbi:MAG: tetrathionate reductase family octaheme c-type cytochrome [Lentimicrobium sp.]|jgi:octaheme c-type cytochrome (tetrathionate reductase family)|nr:tetrathionate reductase family octaheme c-type cytochrome [Lentimicrobium sp.]